MQWQIKITAVSAALIVLLSSANANSPEPEQRQEMPVNLTLAFIGDQGTGPEAAEVLQLIRRENADAVVHAGDLDYHNDPARWLATIDSTLGADFPYFVAMGNHDELRWEGAGGYQDLLQQRLRRQGIEWHGDLGVKSSLHYKGILLILTAPGIRGSRHANYIRSQLAASNAIWRVSCWHKNMASMQIGDKFDETGWDVYEASRRGGAIIATAHDHVYARSHLLSSMEHQTIASTADTLVLTNGRSFVFVSGLGGRSLREQHRNEPHWAQVYSQSQGGTYGALFGIFNRHGIPDLAEFYFKNIDGKVIDRFFVLSNVQMPVPTKTVEQLVVPLTATLEQNYPNPFNPGTTFKFYLSNNTQVRLTIANTVGQTVRHLFDGTMPAGEHRLAWNGNDDTGQPLPSGTYVYTLIANQQRHTRKLAIVR